MRKLIVTALSSALVAVVVGTGCSAPSPDGSSVPRGRSNTGNDNSSDLAGDAGSGDRTCTDHAKVDDRPECDACSLDKCCTEVLACDDASDCTAMSACLDGCDSNDVTCILTCKLQHEKGSEILTDLASCVQQSCAAECPSSAPDGGGFDDPFDS